ncbi:MAG: lipolytic protein G-D-S-L family, partial [Candidatus Omnitrophica bacterium]|nr:lipolytic protein G-D-S-L family [Candidatus Omnitrophota bacterium]
MKRRDLFQATTGIAMASLLQSASFASGEDFLLQDGQTVLFQGDSITDAGRDRDDPKGLGKGYPSLLAPWISASHPDRKIEFLNRGNSGNRVVDLQK